MTARNRIKEHRRVRAGDLVPHESNWRHHPPHQREALAALYQEIGFARSLLAYEMPDGRLKLIDGHLRRDLDPEMLVDVEILDVDDSEARKLLLSMDSVAALAEPNANVLEELTTICQADAPILNELWHSLAKNEAEVRSQLEKTETASAKYLILIECGDEAEQIRLLQRFSTEGLTCRALIS